MKKVFSRLFLILLKTLVRYCGNIYIYIYYSRCFRTFENQLSVFLQIPANKKK